MPTRLKFVHSSDMALRTRVSRASNIRVCRHPIPWTPSRPHSSFEPLIQLDPDGGRRRLAERGPHCNRGKIVSRHYSRVDQHSPAAFTTPLLPQCKHFAHGDGGDDCHSLKKRQEAIREKKGMRRKWSQYLSGSVKRIFTLPGIRARCSLSALHSSER